MTIAIMAHDTKKEITTQLCVAYLGVLSRHKIISTATTGNLIAEATGMPVETVLHGNQGGVQQITSRISCGEVNIVFMLRDNNRVAADDDLYEREILMICDNHNIPVATNVATAEAIIRSLDRGDLDWLEYI